MRANKELTRQEQSRLRWDGNKCGFYENYFIKLVDASQGIALWVRYTLVNPKKGCGDGEAAVWAIFFDARDPGRNAAVKRVFPLGLLERGHEGAVFGLGGARLTHNGAQGEIGGENDLISWDLLFDDDSLSLRRFPRWMYHFPFPKTKMLSPGWNIGISGTFRVGKQEYRVQNAPGHYSHYWGTQYAEHWSWAHGNAFDDGFAFEGLAATVPIAGRMCGSFKLFTFLLDGRLYLTPFVLGQFNIRSRSDTFGWRFEAICKGFKFIGDITARPGEMVALDYHAPDGSHRFCHNSLVSDAVIQVLKKDRFGRWEKWRSFQTNHAVAFETASRVFDAHVKRMI